MNRLAMHRLPVLGTCTALALAPLLPAAIATAQPIPIHMFRGLEKADLAALQPVVRSSLSEDAVGAIRKWESESGKRGFVQLLEGGAAAGLATGTVKITLVRGDRTTTSMVFNYQRDAKGAWRTTG